MKVYFATDHAGFELKHALVAFVRDELHLEVEDCGAFEYDANDDYPELIATAARAVQHDPMSRAIVLGGSGQGEAMVANRYKGVRAAVFYGGTTEIVKLSRQHNDANVLSIGARFLTEDEAKSAVALWLQTDFSGEERHAKRISAIDAV